MNGFCVTSCREFSLANSYQLSVSIVQVKYYEIYLSFFMYMGTNLDNKDKEQEFSIKLYPCNYLSRVCGLYKASDLLVGDHVCETFETVKWICCP